MLNDTGWNAASMLARLTMLTCLCTPHFVFAAESNQATVAKVGIFINSVENIDVKQNAFDCEFYLWFTWRGQYSPHNYEFVNAKSFIKQFEVIETDSAGTNYLSAKVRGTFHADLDVSKYPQDEHILSIKIQSFDWHQDQLRFVLDSANVGSSIQRLEGEWVANLVGTTISSTTFELIDIPYSELKTSIDVRRRIEPFLIKIFVPLILVVAMSMLAFYIPPKNLEAQVTIGVTALLSIIAFHFVINDELPDVGYLTSADILFIGSYVTIFFALVESILVNTLFEKGQMSLSRRIDNICRVAFPGLYIVFLVILST